MNGFSMAIIEMLMILSGTLLLMVGRNKFYIGLGILLIIGSQLFVYSVLQGIEG